MATLSVVSYAPHNKLNILQQSTNDNTDKREILIMRKKQKLLPVTMSGNTTTLVNNQNNNIVNMSKVRKGKTKEKVTNPPPMAVARRNARERNRVKQVNNGFATLRQHIPSEIAAAFENAGNGRGSSKKLSKVETLRMAVEYIRSLEDLLTSDEGESSGNTSGSSMASYPSPQSSSINQGYTFSLQSPLLEDDDDFSNPATPMPIPPIGTQYARIPGTNTFQLIPPPGYEDEENIQPMLGSNQDFILTHPILLDPSLGYITTHLIEASSMSPYSEQSISPSAHVGAGDVTAFIPMMDGSAVYEGQLTMKKEIEDPVIEQSEEMIDVMHWWEQEQRVRHNSLV